MNTKQFRCLLLTDVIISQSSATHGEHKTLDFIPGNAFLGIVASQLYKHTDEHTFQLFHSSNVCFGDAHPIVGDKRCYRIPSSWFHNKRESIAQGIYIKDIKKKNNVVKTSSISMINKRIQPIV